MKSFKNYLKEATFKLPKSSIDIAKKRIDAMNYGDLLEYMKTLSNSPQTKEIANYANAALGRLKMQHRNRTADDEG